MTRPISIRDGLIEGHEDELMTGKCRSDPIGVGGVKDAVRNNNHVTATSLSGKFQGSLPYIDRPRSRFDHDHDHVDGLDRQSSQGADPGFEVGDDDGATKLGGAEQLLGREATSRSTRFRVLDPAHYG